jgi:hypothetical protein
VVATHGKNSFLSTVADSSSNLCEEYPWNFDRDCIEHVDHFW